MKHKLLIVYLFFVCISASLGQSSSKSKIPGINQAKVSQDKICNLGQEMRDGTFPKPGILKINDSQSRSNLIMRPQAKATIPSSSFPGARTAATYTSIYNGVEYSSDHPYNLNVIYFVANDIPLDPTYQSRLSAILLAGQEFYRQNMTANGYGPKTFGLFTETANPANVKIIMINGAEPLSSYPYSENGATELAEINAYFNSNPSQRTSEHTLVITAITDLEHANVGFYGLGRTCLALDYPDFDIQNLGIFEFTKWYGGMMHELGHGLNLPHSSQTNSENADPLKGMNLMSAGNYTLGISPTFINRAGAAILNTNQVFADAPGINYYNGHASGVDSVNAVYDNGNVVLSGTFLSDKVVTDVNIYQNPHDIPSDGLGDGYDRPAWSVSPSGNGFTVTMPVSELAITDGPYYMQIEIVLQNGETEKYAFPFSYNNGIPVFGDLTLLSIFLKPVAALCAGASPNLAIFSENFESGLGAFTTGHETPSASWETRNWVQATAPGGRAGKVAFGADYLGGDCAGSDQSGIISMQSPVVHIPPGTAGNLNMAFYHYIATEDIYDGGNIKYSINGGAWALLPASAFTANGYNKLLATTDNGNTDPMQGQPAFTGVNGIGNIKLWGQSQIDLTSIGLVAGDDIQLRWEMGTDGCGGVDGWYIDDITIYSCTTPAVHFVLASETINESAAMTGPACQKYIDKTIVVQIDTAPSQPVTVTFTPTGTATMGPNADCTIFPASVTLQGGALSQNVTIRIYNDANAEGNETVGLSYTLNTNGGNGHTAASLQSYELTIVDNDVEPALGSANILTIVNTANPAQQYLGPNATVTFTDPTTGFVMAKIQNLTSFDYGCTTVEVNRAGTGATSWFSGYKVTNKTFKVTPSNVNPVGHYQVTLYYTASDLGGFVPVSVGKSDNMIGAGNSAATSQTAIQLGIGMNGNYIYNATFNSGFSGFGLTDAPTAPLPVTLVKFEGKHSPEGNQLSWATTAEVNNEYFGVEKSLNGLKFREISKIAGIGNSSVMNTYKFTDSDFQKGTSYYRLKQVDTDGTYAYSRIISVDGADLQDLKFFPNPVESLLTIELPDAEMKAADVKVFNSVGQQVLVSRQMTTINGQLKLDLAKLPTGIYQLIMTNGNKVKSISVLKL